VMYCRLICYFRRTMSDQIHLQKTKERLLQELVSLQQEKERVQIELDNLHKKERNRHNKIISIRKIVSLHKKRSNVHKKRSVSSQRVDLRVKYDMDWLEKTLERENRPMDRKELIELLNNRIDAPIYCKLTYTQSNFAKGLESHMEHDNRFVIHEEGPKKKYSLRNDEHDN